jgi:Protein of unknown function (DUF998)
MTYEMTLDGTGERSPLAVTTTRRTRMLLACGVLAGPSFLVANLIQMTARDGLDPAAHPISMLSVGDLGWIQIANFVAGGLLFLAAAFGMRTALRPGRASVWGPRLIGALGVALVWGGVFVVDPAYGFPPGTPPGAPDHASWHAMLHTIGPVVGFYAPVAACFVFARRFRDLGQRGWAAYCLATGVASPVVAIAAFPAGDYRLLFAGLVLALVWASVIAARLLTELTSSE